MTMKDVTIDACTCWGPASASCGWCGTYTPTLAQRDERVFAAQLLSIAYATAQAQARQAEQLACVGV